MKHLIFVLLLPVTLNAQKITKETEPITGRCWWVTNQVILGRPGLSPLIAYFRSAPQGALIYLNPKTAETIGATDIAVILTATDTVIARSAGVQTANGSTYWREYRITRSDLKKLAQSPVLKVTLTHFDGIEEVAIPEKNQPKLMLWAKALLQEAGEDLFVD